jgi:hypothetical protein
MEDTVIIEALKEQEKGPNHKSPLKPIDQMRVKVDRLQLDVDCIKRDISIILDHINHQTDQQSKGWWF